VQKCKIARERGGGAQDLQNEMRVILFEVVEYSEKSLGNVECNEIDGFVFVF
jgi:hypothetical protein